MGPPPQIGDRCASVDRVGPLAPQSAASSGGRDGPGPRQSRESSYLSDDPTSWAGATRPRWSRPGVKFQRQACSDIWYRPRCRDPDHRGVRSTVRIQGCDGGEVPAVQEPARRLVEHDWHGSILLLLSVHDPLRRRTGRALKCSRPHEVHGARLPWSRTWYSSTTPSGSPSSAGCLRRERLRDVTRSSGHLTFASRARQVERDWRLAIADILRRMLGNGRKPISTLT